MEYPTTDEQETILRRIELFGRSRRRQMTDAEVAKVILLGLRALRCFPMGSMVAQDARFWLEQDSGIRDRGSV